MSKSKSMFHACLENTENTLEDDDERCFTPPAVDVPLQLAFAVTPSPVSGSNNRMPDTENSDGCAAALSSNSNKRKLDEEQGERRVACAPQEDK